MASSRRPKRVCVRRTPPPTLTAEQIDRIIATTNASPRLHVTHNVVLILTETGIRSNELRRLRVADIDVKNSRLWIHGEMTEGRSIPLTPRALDALQSLHSHFPGSAYVLGDNAAGALLRVGLNFRKTAEQLGIVRQGLYSLRRFYVRHATAVGVDPLTLARLIGFPSVNTLVRRYLGTTASSR